MKYIEIIKKYYNEEMMLWQVTFQIHGQVNFRGNPDINMVGVEDKNMIDDEILMNFLNLTYL